MKKPKVPKRRGRTIYPWDTLPEGESFPVISRVDVASLRSMASRAGRRLGKTFAVRVKDGSVTVWRVA